jgi:hypothetical protein
MVIKDNCIYQIISLIFNLKTGNKARMGIVFASYCVISIILIR